MTPVVPTHRPATPVADWLRPRLRWLTLPSWLMSALFHWGLFVLLLTVSRLPGCQPDMEGQGGEELRQVGIYVRETGGGTPGSGGDSEQGTHTGADEAPDVPDDHTSTFSSAFSPSNASPVPPTDRPPVPLQLPALEAPSVIGLGGPPRTSTGADQLLNPLRGGRGSGGTGAGAGGSGGEGGGFGTGAGSDRGTGATSMFGIQDAGHRFVYVIDSSASMMNFGALRVAKSELMGSLERLVPEQQFQVMFCNSGQLITLEAGRFGMFFGTDAQRLEVQLQISSIDAQAGTDHKQALLAALRMNPDVVFYLSDAGEPFLTTKDLGEIRRQNRGARIHCIHFGEGSQLKDATGQPANNFLLTLASQNNGKYTYRDVRTFIRR